MILRITRSAVSVRTHLYRNPTAPWWASLSQLTSEASKPTGFPPNFFLPVKSQIQRHIRCRSCAPFCCWRAKKTRLPVFCKWDLMDLWWINKTVFSPHSEGWKIYCERYTQSSAFFPATSFSLSLSSHHACDNTLTVHQDVSADLIASSDVICLKSSSRPEKCNIFWSTSDPKKPQIL